MAKKKARDLEKEAHWRKVVAEQQRSGEAVRRYSQEHGLSESAFWFWKRELARREHENESGPSDDSHHRQKSPRRRSRAARAAGSLIPVTIDPRLASDIEISLPSGATVRVAAGCDAATLRTVLATLETARC